MTQAPPAAWQQHERERAALEPVRNAMNEAQATAEQLEALPQDQRERYRTVIVLNQRVAAVLKNVLVDMAEAMNLKRATDRQLAQEQAEKKPAEGQGQQQHEAAAPNDKNQAAQAD